jgi:hypothetical protein
MKILSPTTFLLRSILFFFLLVINFFNVHGQAGVNISKPQLSLENNKLIIEYNIISGNPADEFNIQLRVTDSTGTLIKAKTLSGDIGDSINTGFNKTIVWDLFADKIYLNMGIFIEVKAEKLIMPASVPAEKADVAVITNKLKENEKENLNVTTDKVKTVRSAEIGKNLLLSAIIPGWGLTRLSNGKPYWIIGIIDAGCLAASVYYNKKASSNYTNYLNSSDTNEFDQYFEDASNQYTLSKIFGWSALGIWVADMFLAGIKANNVNNSLNSNKTSRVKIGSYFDRNTSAACLSINYNF